MLYRVHKQPRNGIKGPMDANFPQIWPTDQGNYVRRPINNERARAREKWSMPQTDFWAEAVAAASFFLGVKSVLPIKREPLSVQWLSDNMTHIGIDKQVSF